MIIYREWGKILCAMNERLVKKYVDVANKEGKNSPKAKFLDKSIKNLTDLRNNLEEAMFQEHPNESDTRIFYGNPHERDE